MSFLRSNWLVIFAIILSLGSCTKSSDESNATADPSAQAGGNDSTTLTINGSVESSLSLGLVNTGFVRLGRLTPGEDFTLGDDAEELTLTNGEFTGVAQAGFYYMVEFTAGDRSFIKVVTLHAANQAYVRIGADSEIEGPLWRGIWQNARTDGSLRSALENGAIDPMSVLASARALTENLSSDSDRQAAAEIVSDKLSENIKQNDSQSNYVESMSQIAESFYANEQNDSDDLATLLSSIIESLGVTVEDGLDAIEQAYDALNQAANDENATGSVGSGLSSAAEATNPTSGSGGSGSGSSSETSPPEASPKKYYFAYVRNDGTDSHIHHAIFDGSTWTTGSGDSNIAPTTIKYSRDPSISLDGSTLRVHFLEFNTTGNTIKLFRYTTDGSTTSAATELFNKTGASAASSYNVRGLSVSYTSTDEIRLAYNHAFDDDGDEYKIFTRDHLGAEVEQVYNAGNGLEFNPYTMALDSNNEQYFVFPGNAISDGWPDIRMLVNNGTWGSVIKVVNSCSSGITSAHSDMAINDSDNPEVIAICGSGGWKIRHISGFNGTAFTTDDTIESFTAGFGNYKNKPDLFIDANGALHVAYYNPDSDGLTYAFKAPAASWVIEDISSTTGMGYNARVAAEDTSNVMIVFEDQGNGHLKYARRSDGGSFALGNIDTSGHVADSAGSLLLEGHKGRNP